MKSLPSERLQHAAAAMRGDFDGAREPMRALRDLINVCEVALGSDTFGPNPDEAAVLRRAQDGFSALRRLFGDHRLAEDVADNAMVEPELGDAPAAERQASATWVNPRRIRPTRRS